MIHDVPNPLYGCQHPFSNSAGSVNIKLLSSIISPSFGPRTHELLPCGYKRRRNAKPEERRSRRVLNCPSEPATQLLWSDDELTGSYVLTRTPTTLSRSRLLGDHPLVSAKPVSGPRGSAEGLKDYFRIADDPPRTSLQALNSRLAQHSRAVSLACGLAGDERICYPCRVYEQTH